jgi:hypothetical protein
MPIQESVPYERSVRAAGLSRLSTLQKSDRMPVLFMGHGSAINAIEETKTADLDAVGGVVSKRNRTLFGYLEVSQRTFAMHSQT